MNGKTAIVMGATSGIGQEVARLLARRGWRVGVAGRRESILAQMVSEEEGIVAYEVIDVTQPQATDGLHRLINQLGEMNLYFHSSGIGYQNVDLDAEKELNTVETNCLGMTRLVGEAFRYFESHPNIDGYIAVISSIARTKGLGAAPAYSASKRFTSHYLESLSQLVHIKNLSNIRISDIRPGFVQTPLIEGSQFPMQLNVQQVACDIVEALERRQSVITINWLYRMLVFFWQLIPRWLWVRMRIVGKSRDDIQRTKPPQRSYDLDHLKVFLTVMVIFHHAGQAYGQGGEWPYHPSLAGEYMPEIWRFFSTNAAYLMGLFFLISGLFVPLSYDKQGFATFMRKKLVRLGIPLVIVTLLLTGIVGHLELGTMWYVQSLLCFCLIYGLIRSAGFQLPVGFRHVPAVGNMTALALLMGVGSHLIRQFSPQDHWIWFLGVIHMEPAHYLQYILMFTYGIILTRSKGLQRLTNRTGMIALAIGVGFVLINTFRTGTVHGVIESYFGLFESFLCLFLSIGLLWLFRQIARQTHPFLRWCSEQAYGAYVCHLFVLLGIQYGLDGWAVDIHLKFFLIGLLATFGSFGCTALLRGIPGVKRIL